MKKLRQKIVSYLPILTLIGIALWIAIANIRWNTYYTGWDNIHAEFDFLRYVRQVLFGAWVEHMGLGAPAAQAQLADIFKLPILFILKILLPDNLIRYALIFGYWLIGGLSMYYYVANYWLSEKKSVLKNWLASLAGILYLLHILTLQQFYIAFEMFAIQFAFLPLALVTIHHLFKKITPRSILFFIVVQLLLAPSGHVATLVYLTSIFLVGYAFFLSLKRGLFKGAAFALLVGALSFFSNIYFIVPNLYYSFAHTDYVAQSRDNELFAPESIWSIRDAATVKNFLQGTHYLFSWKDYSFADHKFVFIFDEWLSHLQYPPVAAILLGIGSITVVGAVSLVFAKSKKSARWAILITYLLCAAIIWMGFFPFKEFLDKLYEIDSFREAFRNPLTKFSIIYSFVSVLLFIYVIETIVNFLQKQKLKKLGGGLTYLVLFFLIGSIIYSALPSFQGHFLSEKLRVQYPQDYSELFAFLRTKNSNGRILQLPQLSHAGWEYYDWQFLGKNNGYQGMGFYFFALKQQLLQRDADRWIETSDSFYHQLKYALDKQDSDLLAKLVNKYNIDLIVVDESKIEPHKPGYDYSSSHALAKSLGFIEIWKKGFLTVYERPNAPYADLFIPQNVSYVYTKATRVREDVAYSTNHDYILDGRNADIVYPFSDLMSKELTGVRFTDTTVDIERPAATSDFQLSLPKIDTSSFTTAVQITYADAQIHLHFPQTKLSWNEGSITLPQYNDQSFTLPPEKAADEILLFFGNEGVALKKNQTIYPVIIADASVPTSISFAVKPTTFQPGPQGELLSSEIVRNSLGTITNNLHNWQNQTPIELNGTDKLRIIQSFPVQTVDIQQNDSVNCSEPPAGNIDTTKQTNGVLYVANNFAVSCNGFNFDYASAAYSYLLHLVGDNIQGRATKFFINYTDKNLGFEDYLYQVPHFDKVVTMHPVSQEPGEKFRLNWETRSSGKISENKIENIQITPFPLETISRLALLRKDFQTENNKLSAEVKSKWLDSIYSVETECQSEKCFLALDQSYDQLWLAFIPDQHRFLPHFVLNGWANTWELPQGKNAIIILYLLEPVSFVLLIILLTVIFLLVYIVKRKKLRHSQRKTNRVHQLLLGKKK